MCLKRIITKYQKNYWLIDPIDGTRSLMMDINQGIQLCYVLNKNQFIH